MMRPAPPGVTFGGMRVTQRALALDAGAVLDASIAIVGIGLTAVAVWGPPNLIGTAVAGPPWLLAVLPLLLGGPLVLRRRAPLLMWALVWAAIVLQALITHNSPEGVELIFVLGVGSYSVAAYSNLRRAFIGLGITVAGYAVYYVANHDIMSGQTGNLWSGAFFVVATLAMWLAGVFVRGRRDAAALTRRTAALERRAEQAAADERARIARELHDIVSHNLSVVVLQAAGARASGPAAASTLEKIEHSGRQALVEMRRLLGVLRQADEEPGLTPQPGIGELAALAGNVRAAGLPVRLAIEGDHAGLPAAVDVSAYRIVEEALTNVLKHAGPAHAEVCLRCQAGAVIIEVDDDGAGTEVTGAQPGGQGLVGMRERVALFGGELRAGPRPGGGFSVWARLPITDESA